MLNVLLLRLIVPWLVSVPAPATVLELSAMTPLLLMALAPLSENMRLVAEKVCVPLTPPRVRLATVASISNVTVYVPLLVMRTASDEPGTMPVLQLPGTLQFPPNELVHRTSAAGNARPVHSTANIAKAWKIFEAFSFICCSSRSRTYTEHAACEWSTLVRCQRITKTLLHQRKTNCESACEPCQRPRKSLQRF